MKLNYPSDFPEQSRAKVDVAIEEAEIEFAEAPIKGGRPQRFLCKCLFAFADEECRLALERGWTMGRIDDDVERAFNQLVYDAFDEYRLHVRGATFSIYEFKPDARKEIERDPKWKKYRETRKAVAEAIAAGRLQPETKAAEPLELQSAAISKTPKSRKGDVSLLEGKAAVNYDTAAKYLGVSERQIRNLVNLGKLDLVGQGHSKRVTTESLRLYAPPQ